MNSSDSHLYRGIGLDVEHLNRRPANLMGLAKRRFSEFECDLLAGIELDVELLNRRPANLMGLAKSRFSELERDILAGIQPWDKMQSPAASRQGTMIASTHEATGRDVPHWQQISLDVHGKSGFEERPSSQFQMFLFQPSEAHVAALCVEMQPNSMLAAPQIATATPSHPSLPADASSCREEVSVDSTIQWGPGGVSIRTPIETNGGQEGDPKGIRGSQIGAVDSSQQPLSVVLTECTPLVSETYLGSLEHFSVMSVVKPM
eukprot:gene21520-28507_t